MCTFATCITTIMEENDLKRYESSLRSLWNNLCDSIKNTDPNDRCFVIALSRKGTRMLELLASKYGNLEANGQFSICGAHVVTELSIPLLFKRINKDKGTGRVILKIVDDAIYFGSTILSVYNEIDRHIHYYGLEDKVQIDGIYAAVKSNGSINLKSLTGKEVYADDKIEKGYSHFFVKQLTSDFRGMCNTFEYEFPILECIVNSSFNAQEFESALKKHYGESNTYRIDVIEGMNSFNVVLRNQECSLFNKIRVYYGKGILRIVPMSPCPIYDNYELMANKMSHISHPLANLWNKYYQTLKAIADDVKQDELLFRSTRRLMVILYNYLISLYNFESEKEQIKQILMPAGVNPIFTLKSSCLYSLLADEDIVNDITDTVNAYLRGRPFNRLSVRFRVKYLQERSPLMVESNCVMPNRIKYLDDYNRMLLSKCSTIEEALSALLFNQTVILESYSRTIDANGSRLRFGYTYESMYQELDRYYKQRNTGNWYISNLHRWVDIRIDNGCIVPQYIISTNNNLQWERVFRPGENEDLVLSHLSRYALMVLGLMIDGDPSIGEANVQIDNFERMLAYTFYKYGDDIRNEESFLELFVDDSLRLRFKEGKYVVDYLCDMSILKKSEGMIGIHSRLLESDVYKSSTFSKSLNERITQLANSLEASGIKDKSNYRYVDYTDKFNFFMRRNMKLESVRATYIDAKELFDDFLSNLVMSKEEFLDYQNSAFEKFRRLVSPICVDELLITKYKEDADIPYYDYWIGMSKMFFFMNLLYAIKCYPEHVLRAYAKTVNESLISLNIVDIFQEALSLCGEDGNWNEDSVSYIGMKLLQNII